MTTERESLFASRFWELAQEDPEAFRDCVADFVDKLAEATATYVPSVPHGEILDACCGGRMWWWNKAHPLAVYMDKRSEPKGANPARPNWHIEPDVTGDFRSMPFQDGAFQLVLFDPPHIVREQPSGIYPLYYGALQPETEQDDLRLGFEECWRVLADGGTLVFKWAGALNRVTPHFPATPIVGNRLVRASSGLGTRWIIFYKPLQEEMAV